MIGRVKVSIHASGRCHHALASLAAAEIGSEVNPRLDEWQIEWPRERQVTRAYEIKLLESELTIWDDAPHVDSQPTSWSAAPSLAFSCSSYHPPIS